MKGEKTIKNLITAFIGESMARNRYTIYSKIAFKEGYPLVSNIFLETAEQETEHAKWLYRMLVTDLNQDGKTISLDSLDVDVRMGDTSANLKSAIEGENHEHTIMYPEFAKIALEEGFPKIAARLLSIAKAETHHEQRYAKLLKEIKNKTLFKKSQKIYWACLKCGYIFEGKEAPPECPSCGHPKEYFYKLNEEY